MIKGPIYSSSLHLRAAASPRTHMSDALKLFREIPWFTGADDVAFEKARSAANLWRQDGQDFSAGVAMLRAVQAAWGDPDRMLGAQNAALLDFQHANSRETPASPASI